MSCLGKLTMGGCLQESKVVVETTPGNASTANLAQTEKPGAHRASPGKYCTLVFVSGWCSACIVKELQLAALP